MASLTADTNLKKPGQKVDYNNDGKYGFWEFVADNPTTVIIILIIILGLVSICMGYREGFASVLTGLFGFLKKDDAERKLEMKKLENDKAEIDSDYEYETKRLDMDKTILSEAAKAKKSSNSNKEPAKCEVEVNPSENAKIEEEPTTNDMSLEQSPDTLARASKSEEEIKEEQAELEDSSEVPEVSNLKEADLNTDTVSDKNSISKI